MHQPGSPLTLEAADVRTTPQTAEHRHRLILDVLAREGSCRVADLARRFALSEMTLRRDLLELHARGRLKRVHGGAVAVERDTAFGERSHDRWTQKQQIGRAAARLIQDGWSVFLDSGTTAMEVARAISLGLPGVKRLSVITHGVNIANELVGRTPYDVYVLGGEIYQAGCSAVGPMTLAQVETFHFDMFFMGARGIDAEAGWTNTNHLETQIKHAVMARSRRTCAIVDSIKWGQRALVSVVPFAAVQQWICDSSLPESGRQACRTNGVELVSATP